MIDELRRLAYWEGDPKESNKGIDNAPPGQKIIIVFAVFCVLLWIAFASYFRTIGGGFVLDDYNWMRQVRDGGVWGNALQLSGQTFFRPVGAGIFGLLFKVFGPNPLPFHIFSLIALTITGFAIWGIWSVLFPYLNRWQPLLAGALFVVWGSHSEPVCWAAAFPDVCAGLFGSLSIWAWLGWYRSRKGGFVVLGSLGVLLAIGSKESALPLAMIVPVFLWLARVGGGESWFSWGWVKTPFAWIALLTPAFITAGFWIVRRILIGQWVGGYASAPLNNLSDYLLGDRGTAHFINLFLPTGQEVALAKGAFYPYFAISALGGVGIIWLIYSWPRRASLAEPSEPNVMVLSTLCLSALGGVSRIAGVQAAAGGSRFGVGIWVAMIALCIYSAHHLSKSSRLKGTLAGEYRLVWLLIGALLAATFFCLIVNSALDHFLFFIGTAFYFSGIRPKNPPDSFNGIRFLVIAGSVMAIVCVIPTLNLPIGFDGQQSRFSYFGTIFSVMSFVAMIALIPTSAARVSVTFLVIGLNIRALWLGNSAWVRVGEIANQTAKIVTRAVREGRHVYVLAAPGAIEGAGLFQAGMEPMPYALTGLKSARLDLAYLLISSTGKDLITARKSDNENYRVTFRKFGGPNIIDPILSPVPGTNAFVLTRHNVHLLGYKLGDVVLVIGYDGPVQINQKRN